MQAFILRKSPQNLTAGVTLGECTLSFECNIALPGRQSRRSTARPETIVIALDFILNRTRLWHCQKVCLKIRNIIVIRATRTVKRAPAFSISFLYCFYGYFKLLLTFSNKLDSLYLKLLFYKSLTNIALIKILNELVHICSIISDLFPETLFRALETPSTPRSFRK